MYCILFLKLQEKKLPQQEMTNMQTEGAYGTETHITGWVAGWMDE
jgi:hypothetical protein